MKYIITIFFSLICGMIMAQTEAMPYQSILTTADGDIIKNSNVEVRVDIIEDNSTGTVSYSETHTTQSGINGELSLELGNGTPVNMTIDNIDWERPNYIKLSFKPEGFTTFFDTQTIQMLSVPYALFALNVKCEQGCPGQTGEDGQVGPAGPRGLQGVSGIPGTNGINGIDGQAGSTGVTGAQTLIATSNIPNNPAVGRFYIDDGSNRSDGLPGFRMWDGNQWLNL